MSSSAVALAPAPSLGSAASVAPRATSIHSTHQRMWKPRNGPAGTTASMGASQTLCGFTGRERRYGDGGTREGGKARARRIVLRAKTGLHWCVGLQALGLAAQEAQRLAQVLLGVQVPWGHCGCSDATCAMRLAMSPKGTLPWSLSAHIGSSSLRQVHTAH